MGNSSRSSFLIAGAGALGSAIGGMLRLAGHDVTLLGRNARHLEAVSSDGLRMTGIWGEHVVKGFRIAEKPEGLTEAEYVLVATKSFDTEGILDEVTPGQPRAQFVTLQNGIGNLEAVARRVGETRAIGGAIIIGFELLGPGAVAVTVYGGEVQLGRLTPRPEGPDVALTRLVDFFNGAGIPSRVTDNVRGAIWGKALYNCALNALGAVLCVPYGELDSEPLRRLMRDVVVEAFAVARAEGVELAWPTPEAYLDVLYSRQIPATAAHRASMLQDLERGRRTEIDYMNGAIERLGAAKGLPTPANTLLAALVRFLERRRKPQAGQGRDPGAP